ncbi:MAG TPA: iron ABC transporter permease, partial [Spirochaetia bacterium]|nr:iron ABC transporter permease [Spirochaetia bacterium]
LLLLLTDPVTAGIILFTLKQALLSTLLSLLLGLPGAYLLTHFDFWGKNVVKAVTTVPFVLPSILVVLGFVRFFGNNGILNRMLMELFRLNSPPLRILYSLKAIVLAHAFYNFPICIRIVSSVWSRLNPHIEEAARTLGARGWRLFVTVTLPRILPGILAAAALIFIFCFTSFAVVLVLGGGPRYTTLEVEIYRLAKVSLDMRRASSLALVGAFLSLLLLYAYIKIQQKTSYFESSRVLPNRKRLAWILNKPYGLLILIYLILVFVIIAGPMLAVVHYSFLRRSGWAGQTHLSLEWYGRLFSPLKGASGFAVPYLRAISNSFFFGFMTVLIAVPLGTSLAYIPSKRHFTGKPGFQSLLMLPMGISTIILGLSYLRVYRDLPVWRGGAWVPIVLAHSIIACPFVIRSVSSVMDKLNPSLAEAAQTLGASPWRVFRHVEFPLMKPGIVTSAAFAFAISIGEINATLMLYEPDLVTIPIAIYRLISSYNFFAACAMGSILMLSSFIAFLIIDRIGGEVV